ncbi:IS3 family transposase [Solimonas sp. K1W22B-7]|nr:IS3 family transposase [Solimonas sp. K1W22B-7]
MESRSKRTQRDYTMAFKLAVVDQVEKGEMSCRQAQERYGIQGSSTVLQWVRRYGRPVAGRASWAPQGKPMMSEKKPLTPEQRIKQLEVELREAKEKAQFFEAVVDVLKKDYGVVVKKPVGVLAQKLVMGLSVKRACRYMGISRQAYYQRLECASERAQTCSEVIRRVEQIRLRQPRVGTRKLQHLLQRPNGIHVGRDTLFSILRNARMLVPSRRAYHKTTDSHHRFRKHPNLLKPGSGIQPATGEQVWVADITYLPTREKCVYLSLVTDAYSRKIVGYHVHDSLQTEQVSEALKMALKTRQTAQRLIHHSDRGIQYCSNVYQQIHQRHGLTCSMTDGYDCYQNALAERVNGILKNEFLLQRPANLEQAEQMVRQSIHIYNHERPHLALKYKTPDEVHRASVSSIL